MKQNRHTYWNRCLYSLCILLIASPFVSKAQSSYVIHLAQIDGVDLTPDNIFNFTIQQAGGASSVLVRGTIKYRNSSLSLSYSFRTNLKSGMNTFNSGMVYPQWQFSSPDLQDLFLNYRSLPAGTYQYCIQVLPDGRAGEAQPDNLEECLYHQSDESFLINLVEPEDKAKLKEHNPIFSWIANYSAATMLSYRIRIADIKHGQNAVNAVTRNQPIYSEGGLQANSLVYPQFAKPLVKNQRYAWTVDAYYKSLLLGGSETWEFSIIDDTVVKILTPSSSYIDVKLEKGSSQLFAVGELKLKYFLDEVRTDVLSLQLYDGEKQVTITPNSLAAQYGDNRYIFDLREKTPLKHLHDYRLVIASKTGHVYTLLFRYINPDYTK